MLGRHQKLAVYVDGALDAMAGKMAYGILRYSRNPVVCLIDSQHAGKDAADVTGIPRTTPIVRSVDEAIALGAEVFVLGIAPPGGLIPAAWYPIIDRAVEAGLCVVNGLHDLLGPRYTTLRQGQWVWDIRVEPDGLAVNEGRARELSARRVLMIGTDMSVGKMTAGLEMWREALSRGVRAEFVATGQVGITILGSGVPLDAIRVDFASGAIEREMLRYPDAELIVVEGQGALVHPGSTANLPLLRGSMPTHLVLCHKAGMERLKRVPWVKVPPLRDYLRLYEDLAEACVTFPRPRTAGVALDTRGFNDDEARLWIEETESELGVPATDPVRFGPKKLVDALLDD